MPELPEAEANRRFIERHCLHRTIEEVALGEDTEHVDLPPESERSELVGHQFTRTHRHGKHVFCGSTSGPWLAFHLGMTGRVVPFDEPEAPPPSSRLVIKFEGKRRLAFRNPRKFGSAAIIDSPQRFVERKGLGCDALKIDEAAFAKVIGGTRGYVKPALMAQKKIAGLGNLWADEILFQVGVEPETRADELSKAALEKLFGAMGSVLEAVIETEIDYEKLPGDWLIANREDGRNCPRCRGTIRKKTVGGRSSYFCPDHQKRAGAAS